VDPNLTALAGAAVTGDGDAVTDLIAATHLDVWRLCAYLVDRQSADDLAQETFLRAVKGLRSLRDDNSVRSWLLTIARRVCAGELDARARRRDLALKVRPLAGAERHDTADVDIELLIAGLAVDRRIAFVLTQVIGCDYAEAAAICECPIGTIRSRVARARDDLIAALNGDERAASSRQLS
jgi:RNA polymerase sigma-70 factor (ECF subfamily)